MLSMTQKLPALVHCASLVHSVRAPGPPAPGAPEQKPPHTGHGCGFDDAMYVIESWRSRTAPAPVCRFVVPTTSSLNWLTTHTDTPPDDSGSGGPWNW